MVAFAYDMGTHVEENGWLSSLNSDLLCTIVLFMAIKHILCMLVASHSNRQLHHGATLKTQSKERCLFLQYCSQLLLLSLLSSLPRACSQQTLPSFLPLC